MKVFEGSWLEYISREVVRESFSWMYLVDLIFLLATEIAFSGNRSIFEVFLDEGSWQTESGCEVATIDGTEEC